MVNYLIYLYGFNYFDEYITLKYLKWRDLNVSLQFQLSTKYIYIKEGMTLKTVILVAYIWLLFKTPIIPYNT